MAEEQFHVGIAGAGIAGLALAIGLHKKGIPFTLYEEAPQHSVVGAGIGFGPNGLQAMDLLEEEFRPKYEAIAVGNKQPKDQEVFFEGLLCEEGLGLEESWYGHSSWGAPKYTRKSAHRKELLEVLTSFIPLESVKFNKRLANIEEKDDRVLLHFADGEADEVSILIGSDGIQSVAREHVLRPLYPSEVEPVYAHSYAYRAVIPISEAKELLGDLTDTAKVYLGKDRTVITYRVSGGTEFNFLHTVTTDTDKPWPVSGSMIEKVTPEQMYADFDGRGIDERLLSLLRKARPLRWGLFHHLHTSTYYRGRVALIGDSAHASLPYQAAGAGQALEDALILTKVLGNVDLSEGKDVSPQLQAAFEGYDAVRRPRAQRQLEQSSEAANLINFRDPDAGSDMSKILRRMQAGRFDWLWFHDLREDVQLALDTMRSSGSLS